MRTEQVPRPPRKLGSGWGATEMAGPEGLPGDPKSYLLFSNAWEIGEWWDVEM